MRLERPRSDDIVVSNPPSPSPTRPQTPAIKTHLSNYRRNFQTTKKIIHHKAAARVVCVFSEHDAHIAARAAQLQLRRYHHYHYLSHLSQHAHTRALTPTPARGHRRGHSHSTPCTRLPRANPGGLGKNRQRAMVLRAHAPPLRARGMGEAYKPPSV